MPARTPKLASTRCLASESSLHRRSKPIEKTAAFAICDPVAGESGSNSEMLTPPATLRSGLNANFSRGVIVERSSYGPGIWGWSASASSVAPRQSDSNQDHSRLAPSRRVPSFLVSKRNP